MKKTNIFFLPRPYEYNTEEKIEKYFLQEFAVGETPERQALLNTVYKNREKFLKDCLLAFFRSTDDYTDTEMLNKAIGHGICNAIIRKLENERR